MKTFNELKKNLKLPVTDFKKAKVALLGDSATQYLTLGIKAFGIEKKIDLELFEADYDQIEGQVFDTQSPLYEFEPEYIVIFNAVQKLRSKFYNQSKEQKSHFTDYKLEWIESIYTEIKNNTNAKIIYLNLPDFDDAVFGNYANKVDESWVYQSRKLNVGLMDLSIKLKDLYIADINALQNRIGNAEVFNNSNYVSIDLALALDFIPHVSKSIVDIIACHKGDFKKCVILDLDNTLWGGIIGDDGIEKIEIGNLGIGKAFTDFQKWIKQLKERGIILAVCSKNNESTAMEPFESHPDMVLKLDDIAVFVANWENKADNILYIQSVLNIGLDSMVFLDDNIFERNMVRTHVPDILVPELPEDPANYLEYLQSLNLFETSSYSEEDNTRNEQYRTEAKRSIAQRNFTDEKEYLKSLEMTSVVKAFDKFSIPRVSQLTQRSNQFNLRTIRYSEEDALRVSQSNSHYTLSFTLEDKFGDNGLICVIILFLKNKDTLFIDTWLMSCRVLKRGMENFTLNTIVQLAKDKGFKTIIGEYIPTAKNKMVEYHYTDLGFIMENNTFKLDVNTYVNKETFIYTKP